MSLATLKALGKAAAIATKTAVVAAADATAKTVAELQQIPTSIKCSNCPLEVPVPPTIFDWACTTAACEAKRTVHPPAKKVCEACMQPRPPQTPKSVTCSTCGHSTVVPISNARKHAATAGRAVHGAAVAVKDGAVNTYQELKAAPTSIACSGCTTPLEVPPTLFDWTCEKADCLKVNAAAAATCEQCGTVKGKQEERKITCAVCQNQTIVPQSNASKHLGTVTKATKEFAASASSTVKSAYQHARSSPVHFNCTTCNELLQVPGYWVCKGCSAQNLREPASAAPAPVEGKASPAPATPAQEEGRPHDASAAAAEEKKKLLAAEDAKEAKAHDATHCPVCGFAREAEMVQCGKCHQPTVVPRSNFSNSLKKTGNVMARSFTKIWYDVSSTPYITCDQCQATVKVPQPAAAPPASPAAAGAGGAAAAPEVAPPAAAAAGAPSGPVSVECEACHKTFAATVSGTPKAGGGPAVSASAAAGSKPAAAPHA